MKSLLLSAHAIFALKMEDPQLLQLDETHPFYHGDSLSKIDESQTFYEEEFHTCLCWEKQKSEDDQINK